MADDRYVTSDHASVQSWLPFVGLVMSFLGNQYPAAHRPDRPSELCQFLGAPFLSLLVPGNKWGVSEVLDKCYYAVSPALCARACVHACTCWPEVNVRFLLQLSPQ